MIDLKLVRELPVSAASGLVRVDGGFYAVSDDEVRLLRFTQAEQEFYPLLDLELPREPKARKKAKPDFEALCLKDGLIYVFPSGSKENRMVGVCFDPRTSEARTIDLSRLYLKLMQTIPDLNIEGADYHNGQFLLLSRGNGPGRQNALIRVSADLTEVRELKLVDLEFGFTDLCVYQGELYFLAVKEDTQSTYDDGPFQGAILGRLDLHGKVAAMETLEISEKPEGLWIEGGEVFLVTDADDASIPSKFYRGFLDVRKY